MSTTRVMSGSSTRACRVPRATPRHERSGVGRPAALARAVIRLLAAGVVRGVDHFPDFGHALLERDFDALLERHVHHAAALTSPAELDVGHAVLRFEQRDPATVSGDLWIDLFVEHLLDRKRERLGPERI